MKTTRTIPFDELPSDYAALCRLFLPRPIRDVTDYENTVEMTDSLAGFEERMNRDQNDYFDLLCQLIENYEKDDPPVATGLELLTHLAAEHQLSGAGISRILGKSASLGPMILRGDRRITADHAVRLGGHFGLPPGAFLS